MKAIILDNPNVKSQYKNQELKYNKIIHTHIHACVCTCETNAQNSVYRLNTKVRTTNKNFFEVA